MMANWDLRPLVARLSRYPNCYGMLRVAIVCPQDAAERSFMAHVSATSMLLILGAVTKK